MFKELILSTTLLLPITVQAAPFMHDGRTAIPTSKLEAEVGKVLSYLGENNSNVRKLLVETAAVETDMGQWKQWSCRGNYGTFQFRVDSARYLLKWAKDTSPALHKKVMASYDHSKSLKDNLKTNVSFGAAMVVLHFKERKGLKDIGSVQARAKSWKKNYNTYLGKGSVAGYVKRAKAVSKRHA